jgi:hypothetical protein
VHPNSQGQSGAAWLGSSSSPSETQQSNGSWARLGLRPRDLGCTTIKRQPGRGLVVMRQNICRRGTTTASNRAGGAAIDCPHFGTCPGCVRDNRVADVDVVAALMCEVPPKRRRHLTHRAASRRRRSRSSFGWRTSTLCRRRGLLHEPVRATTSRATTVVVASAPIGMIDTTTTTTATTAGTTTTTTDSTASSCSRR